MSGYDLRFTRRTSYHLASQTRLKLHFPRLRARSGVYHGNGCGRRRAYKTTVFLPPVAALPPYRHLSSDEQLNSPGQA